MKQTNYFKWIWVSLCFCITTIGLAQEKEIPEHEKLATQQVFTGNEQMLEGNVLEAEKSYRKAIAKDPNNLEAKYNLGYSYYKTKNFQEAVERNKQSIKDAKTKGEKHIANHNLGNSYLQMGKPEEAIDAYKNALRNNPTDEETRYNLAVARQMKQQQDQNKDQNQDQDQDSKDKKDEGEGDNKDNKDSDKGDDKDEDKEGDKDKDEEGKDDEPKDEKEGDEKEGDEEEKEGDGDKPKDDEGKEKPSQPKEGKLSPEQVKSLLEAMAEEEKKVQDKMNKNKARGVKVQSEKDW